MSEVQVREKWGSAERGRRWKQTCNNCMLLNINELKQSRSEPLKDSHVFD